jgi:hypothetical protein
VNYLGRGAKEREKNKEKEEKMIRERREETGGIVEEDLGSFVLGVAFLGGVCVFFCWM